MTQPAVFDFETEAIESRPKYPPKPVGVSIWHPEADAPQYYSWGHPSENNCSYEEARNALANVWDQELLCHHARFDMDVAAVHMGLGYPKDPLRVHDTLFLNYLYDVHAPSLSLKPSAARILDIPPDEQDDLRSHLAGLGYAGKDWGAHIAKAPGGIVGRYANGDTYRTRRLFDHLLDHVNKQGMLAAYRREQKLAPILTQSETDGIRIDRLRLEKDLVGYEAAYLALSKRLLGLLGDINLDSAGELARALIQKGLASEGDFLTTPTGKLSTAKASMDQAVKEPVLRGMLRYRGQLKTLLTTFMRPWLEFSAKDGRLRPNWNQVKGDEYGTRTGRLSSNDPNLQNVPTELDAEPPEGMPPLPLMRQYILPDEGHVLVSSDFNGQEMRIASHFAEGRAADIYRDDPGADFHRVVAAIIKAEAGLEISHKMVKITGFSLLYGSGINSLAALLGVDKATASKIRNAYFMALPGFQELMDDVARRGRQGSPVRTWGGRLIYAEPSKLVKGQQWTFEYKLTNYLIQGSAADQTKEAIHTAGYKSAHRRFLATVHDENVYSVNPDKLNDEVAVIKHSMEGQTGWDVPFKAKVKVGHNWQELIVHEEHP